MQATLFSALGLDDDRIGLIDLTTGYDSGFVVYTHQAPLGTLYDFGHVNAGDQLEFYLKNNNPIDAAQTFYSDPSLSTDEYNHVYEYHLGGSDATGNIADATFLGFPGHSRGLRMERGHVQCIGPGGEQSHVILVASAPEPGTLVLLGTGVLGIAGTIRRRLSV